MDYTIRMERTDAGTVFYAGDLQIGTALTSAGCKDHLVPLGNGAYRWDRWTPEATDALTMRFEAAYEMTYQLSPAFMYNGNRSDNILDYNKVRRMVSNTDSEDAAVSYYQGCIDEQTGLPWKMAWWHMSIPGATYTEGKTDAVAMFLPPDQLDGSASVYPDGSITVHETVWPEQDMPRMPSDENGLANPLVEPAGIPGKVRSGAPPKWSEGRIYGMEPRKHFAVILVFAPVLRPRHNWHRLMDVSWEMYRKTPTPKYSEEELWDMGVAFAKSLYFEEADGFKSTAFGHMYIDGEWKHRPLYRYELGWCGQAASIATSLLVQAVMNGDKEAEQMAFNSLDSWITQTLPGGILPTHVREQEFPWEGRRIVDACNLSAGALQFFRSWELAQMLGKSKPEYFKAACDICDFALAKMSPDGKLAKSWFEDDLTVAQADGTTGAFLTMALCAAAEYTGDKKYLDGAIRSFDYYNSEFLRDGYTSGGAQDVFTIDKESAIPLLKATLALYDLTGDERYVDCAEDAAQYLSTWQWVYSRPMSEGCALHELEYNTYGGTSVSMMGAGQDPYALFYVQELYDLADLTGNEIWAERAHAAWCNGHDGVSDGTMVANGRRIPYGGQHEARGIGNYGQHNVYQWLVAWPTAFRLECLRRKLFISGDRKERDL